MLLLEHKQRLQSYDAQSSIQSEIFSAKKKKCCLRTTKKAGRDYNKLLTGFMSWLTPMFTYFWGRGFIEPGRQQTVLTRMEIAVQNKGKICENNVFF